MADVLSVLDKIIETGNDTGNSTETENQFNTMILDLTRNMNSTDPNEVRV